MTMETRMEQPAEIAPENTFSSDVGGLERAAKERIEARDLGLTRTDEAPAWRIDGKIT